MKKTILALIITASVATFTFAQEKVAPRTEFTIELSVPSLEIKQGEVNTVTINLNRSKGYTKSNAVLGLSSGLPQGVTITFEPAEGVMTSSIAHVIVAENAKPGNYMIILNSTMQFKSKGATLKLVVKDSTSEAVSKS